MHFSPLLFSLGALAATFTANPAPALLTEALPALDAGTAELGRDALSGNLPKNLAKIWIFSNLNCDQNNGPAWNIYVLPGEDRCIPYQNVGSIFAWYESDIGLVERDSIPVRCCAISAHGVPDPVHADGALCPEELRWLIGGLLAGHYAAMLLLDRAFVPNDPVFAAVSDRGSGQEGHGGDDREDETHLW
ncbi:uncharacterized protein J4E78_000620 [Alternaria triticimaculans]|uniref:uncharacterized protein n=1 Tax=Alternaria triticimaculans TaxID=297637 RepID=UPI0020C4DD16|nr:uncharacterized protein J4E78_000620 [Alternaria triticimaculans]KAI4672120.1 hypothetical protein J4E78_000620 [Alternaria triticimaculans]